MATETVAPPHATIAAATDELLQQVEKIVNDEVKTSEVESTVLPSTQSGEAENTISEESEEKAKDMHTQRPAVKADDPGEENFEVAQDTVTDADKNQPTVESIGKQPQEQTAKECVEKHKEEQPNEGIAPEASVEGIKKPQESVTETQPPIENDIKGLKANTSVLEPGPYANKSQMEEQPAIDSIGEQPEEQPGKEFVEKQAQEQLMEITDVPKASVEAIEKSDEQSKSTAVGEGQIVVEECLEAEPREVVNPDVISEVDIRMEAQSEVAEQAKISEATELKDCEEADTVKDEDEGALHSKIKDTVFFKDEPICKYKEPSESKSCDEIAPIQQEVQAHSKADGEEFSLHSLTEQACSDDGEKELSGASAVEALPEETPTVIVKIDEENEAKSGNSHRDVQTEELNQPVKDKVEDVINTISTTEVTEETVDEENCHRDVEVVSENKAEENVRDGIPEAKKEGGGWGKQDEVSLSAAVGEPHESELEVKREETEKIDVDNLGEEKTVTKSDVKGVEALATKEADGTKTSKDLPTEQVLDKPIHKHSNNIISKVKQSLVKAKKAIIGKSPSSKTLTSDAKGDIKVK